MKLIIGLGNPGEKYSNNRHNVGQMLVDRLQSTVYSHSSWENNRKLDAVVCSPKSVDVLLAKPLAFMNDSGEAIQKLVNFYKVDLNDLYIVHDDLDIRLGAYKIQKGKGPKIHNGVNSVEESLGTPEFWRVRVGVDNRDTKNRMPGEAYVLQDFTEDELEILNEVLSKVVKELKNLASQNAIA